MSIPLVALHGFLGHPRDFKILGLENLRAPNIFASPLCPLENWAARFNQRITQKPALLGYSMGGRLALHCLLNNPSIFSCAIIVAAHPGIKDPDQRSKRLAHDLEWAGKFNSLEWSLLMNEWENMPALRSSIVISRQEKDYDRKILSSAMRYFSLGSQSYLVPAINELTLPILWLAAENELGNIDGLKLSHPLSQLVLLKGGHRFIFENAPLFNKLIVKFLAKIAHAE
jgi:2-succinyl-6-hydroxy-2,4-cyclohexadiene-1-carboxylate synthase